MENVASDYKFYRIPKRFFKEEQFRDMTNAAKVLYGIHDILQPETSEWTPEIQLKKRRNKK